MSVSHRHGDIFVAHELLQLHERNLTRLRQSGGSADTRHSVELASQSNLIFRVHEVQLSLYI